MHASAMMISAPNRQSTNDSVPGTEQWQKESYAACHKWLAGAPRQLNEDVPFTE
jgi:hypothetical protein